MVQAGASPWDLAGPSIIGSRALCRGEPEMRRDAPGKSPRVRETVRQDYVRENAVLYDDELVRRGLRCHRRRKA